MSTEACSLGGLSPAYVNAYAGPPIPSVKIDGTPSHRVRTRVQITTDNGVATLDLRQVARLTEWLVHFGIYGDAPEPGNGWPANAD